MWDSGVEKKNEWVYASMESDAHKNRLLDWLRSKGIEEKAEILCFDPSWRLPKKILWRDFIQNPDAFFNGVPFLAVSIDLTWALGYMKEGVARFGRWKREAPNL